MTKLPVQMKVFEYLRHCHCYFLYRVARYSKQLESTEKYPTYICQFSNTNFEGNKCTACMYKENHYFDNYQTFNYQRLRKSTVNYANISNKLQLKVFNEAKQFSEIFVFGHDLYTYFLNSLSLKLMSCYGGCMGGKKISLQIFLQF